MVITAVGSTEGCRDLVSRQLAADVYWRTSCPHAVSAIMRRVSSAASRCNLAGRASWRSAGGASRVLRTAWVGEYPHHLVRYIEPVESRTGGFKKRICDTNGAKY